MTSSNRSPLTLAALTVLTLMVSLGCSSSDGLAPPATPAGRGLAFVLGALNGAPVSNADVTAHFSPTFLAAVPASALETTAAQLSAQRMWTLVGFDGTPAPEALTAVVLNDQHEYSRIAIVMNGTNDTLIDDLNIEIAPDLDPSLQSWGAIDSQLQGLAPEVSELAATIDDSAGCTSLHALAADMTRPLGSQFKLYVLATLAQSVASGARAWSDPLAIQDQYKSLPSGTFQDQPDGSTFTLEQFADNMISQSDNTAADHLMALLGRDQIEAMLATAHHHDPAEDQPFLTTREFFDLKLLVTEADRQAYIADSIDGRRAVLASYDATLDPRTFTGNFASPVDVDTIEWFASPNDLCNVLTALKTYADQPATSAVSAVLSINPGIPDGANLFSYVGFKGGSEPGVLSLSWLVQRASDQAWRVYSVELASPQAALDENRAAYLAGAARALLAR